MQVQGATIKGVRWLRVPPIVIYRRRGFCALIKWTDIGLWG